jgi:hypothetical protein
MPSLFRRAKRSKPEPAPAEPARPDEAALAWFCRRLPTLRTQADRLGWRRELEIEVQAVREGRPAAEALRNLMLDDQASVRGDNGAGLQELWDPAPIGQRFTCPRFVCPARGRDADATEPWCHMEDRPMNPSTHRLGS